MSRRRGRQPQAQAVVVRLIEPAFDDLVTLNRRDPQIVRWALKKMLLLERDPEAGEGLKGALIGWRKITVGDRDWRIVWRVTHDEVGAVVVDIAEVWAVGAREDSTVYAEMADRVTQLGNDPKVLALSAVIHRLGKVVAGLSAQAEPAAPEPAPAWLVRRLVKTVGIDPVTAAALSAEEALDTWTAWVSRPQD